MATLLTRSNTIHYQEMRTERLHSDMFTFSTTFIKGTTVPQDLGIQPSKIYGLCHAFYTFVTWLCVAVSVALITLSLNFEWSSVCWCVYACMYKYTNTRKLPTLLTWVLWRTSWSVFSWPARCINIAIGILVWASASNQWMKSVHI